MTAGQEGLKTALKATSGPCPYWLLDIHTMFGACYFVLPPVDYTDKYSCNANNWGIHSHVNLILFVHQ